jgi:hypothetical protein
VALFRHYCTTVAERNFTILVFVHRPSLNYKRRCWYRKGGGENGHNGKRDQTTHTSPTKRAPTALIHAQRLGTLSLSRPKLVSPTTSPCGHIEHFPELDVGHPLGAETSIISVSLSPTIQTRRTNHTKNYCRWYQTPTVGASGSGTSCVTTPNKGPDAPR